MKKFFQLLGVQLALSVLVITVMLILSVVGVGLGLPLWARIFLLVVGLLIAVVWLVFTSIAGERLRVAAVSVLVVISALSTLAAGVVAYSSAESLILETRGRWTEAEVIHFRPSGPSDSSRRGELPAACVLETAEGERIRPHLDAPRGCVGLTTGSRVNVIYDPWGQVKPRTDDPPSYVAAAAWLAGVGAGTGTLSGVLLASAAGRHRWWNRPERDGGQPRP